MPRRRKPKGRVVWSKAPDVQKVISSLVARLDISWVDAKRIHCFRSINSTARAYARIWGLNNVWQLALDQEPAYVIEVLSEHFDDLKDREKNKVLLHEIAHIPKNFSGALLPHVRRRGKRNFHDRVEEMIRQYDKLK